jgi:hypothetical protein
MVGRLRAVVDDRGALAGLAGLGRVGGVGGPLLHALGQVRGRLAADRPDPIAAAGQLSDQGAARASGRAQDHVQLIISVHGRLLRRSTVNDSRHWPERHPFTSPAPDRVSAM